MKTTCVAMLLLAIVSMAGAQTENTDTNSPATFEHAELSALQVVTEFLRALQDHDAKKAKSLLHPELVWDQPGNNRFSGIWKAVPEVSRMFGGMFELTAKTIKLASISVLAVNG
ncbi:MAG: nuclear transport factor 2 family protein, partial [Bacteroidota bacterium]